MMTASIPQVSDSIASAKGSKSIGCYNTGRSQIGGRPQCEQDGSRPPRGSSYPQVCFPKERTKSTQESRNWLYSGSTPIPEIKEADRNVLLEYFREKNTNLAKLTGQSLDKWQR